MTYQEPTRFKESGDQIFTNFGQEVELQEREIDSKPNPEFVKRRNANSRVWLKGGKTVRILAEIDGVVDKTNALAKVVSSCKVSERQPVSVRVRLEEPSTEIPTDPALEVIG